MPLAFGAYRRLASRHPEIAQTNMVAEASPTGRRLICRPGLTMPKAVGEHPIRGLAQRQGLFGSDTLVLAAQTMYRLAQSGVVTPLTGAIPDYTRVRIEIGRNGEDEDLARVATGDGLYSISATAVTQEPFPEEGGAGATDICYHRGYWVAVVAGSEVFNYLPPGGSTWEGLDFASAEYQPDKAIACRTRGDQLWLLGEVTTEAWALTGDGDAPLAPYGGMNYDFGCRARDSAVIVQTEDSSALIFVDNAGAVRLTTGGDPKIISDEGLTESIRLAPADTLRAWGFAFDNHFYYVLTIADAETAVYDAATELWSRFASTGEDYWRAHLGCNSGPATVLAADALSNTIWQVSPEALDDDGDPIAVEFTAFYPLDSGREECWNLTLACAIGFNDIGETDPKVSMRLCRDGQVYGAARELVMSARGEFANLPRWNRNGQIRGPHGLWARFSMSDLMVKSVSGVIMNVDTR